MNIFYEPDGGAPGGGAPAAPPEPAPDVNTAGAEPAAAEPAAGDNANAPQAAPLKPKSVFDPPPKPEPPDKYEFNLAEGLSITEDMQQKLTAVARENGLTQKGVDALLRLHGEVMLDTMRQAIDEKNNWAEECSKQGLLEPEKMEMAKATVRMFGGSEAMQVLVDTGAANHPAILKMLQTIGSYLVEDKPPAGQAAGVDRSNDVNILFPNSKY